MVVLTSPLKRHLGWCVGRDATNCLVITLKDCHQPKILQESNIMCSYSKQTGFTGDRGQM